MLHKSSSRRTLAFSVRVAPELHAAISQAADASGRSVAQEIERRLQASLADTSLARTIREQMAAIIQPAVDEAIAKAMTAVPEPAGSPPPAYTQ